MVPLVGSQRPTVPSAWAVRTLAPPSANVAESIEYSPKPRFVPSSALMRRPVEASQVAADWSVDAVTIVVPWPGLNSTELTAWE